MVEGFAKTFLPGQLTFQTSTLEELFERAKTTESDNFYTFEQNRLDQLKRSVSSLVTHSIGATWSHFELASFLFSVYQMGENDWKSVSLEEPGDYNRKRTPSEMAEKWREIKFLRSKSVDKAKEGRSFGESQWLLKVINFLL